MKKTPDLGGSFIEATQCVFLYKSNILDKNPAHISGETRISKADISEFFPTQLTQNDHNDFGDYYVPVTGVFLRSSTTIGEGRTGAFVRVPFTEFEAALK